MPIKQTIPDIGDRHSQLPGTAVTMRGRTAYKCAGSCRSTSLLGCASTLGTLLVTAILLQPAHGAQSGETAAAVSAEHGDLSFFAAANRADDLPAARDDETCATTCLPATNSGRNRYFFADALLWTVREGVADNWAQIITPMGYLGLGTNVGTTTVVDAPFDWRTGLRVGMGVQRCNGFDLTAYYTNFRTSATSQASGEVYSALMGNFYIGNTDGSDYGPYYRHASIFWDFSFHSIDLEIGRNYAIGSNLELRPFLGLKAAMIKQAIRSNWSNPVNTVKHTYSFTSATEDMDLDFWGIGPSLGVTITMPLYNKERYSLKLFGTPSGAIMFGHWKFTELYQNDGNQSVAIDMSPITGAATMLRGVIGLEWEQYFARATSTVRLGYEAQFWLNQMQFYSYNMGRLNNVASLQGGFVEWSIRF
jgi:hypothetical protein